MVGVVSTVPRERCQCHCTLRYDKNDMFHWLDNAGAGACACRDMGVWVMKGPPSAATTTVPAAVCRCVRSCICVDPVARFTVPSATIRVPRTSSGPSIPVPTVTLVEPLASVVADADTVVDTDA